MSFPALKTKNFPVRDSPADSLCCINNNIRIGEQILIFGGSRETQKLEGNMRKNEEGARRKLRMEQGERTKIRREQEAGTLWESPYFSGLALCEL